jgi:cytidylate kinase
VEDAIMGKQIHEEPKIMAAAERRMLVRAKALEVEDRVERHRTDIRPTANAVQYIAISREAGAGGGEIGQMVGKRLGWKVYDKNLMDQMAEEFQISRTMLDPVDETRSNWLYDVLGTWMDRKIVPHEKYVAYLSRVLFEVSKQGNAVFVGRAAQFVLPRPHILAVRIVAAEKYRIRQIMAKTGVNEAAAQQSIHALDEGRRELVERFFHHDIADPHHYDMVLNADHLGPDGVAELIVAAVSRQIASAKR